MGPVALRSMAWAPLQKHTDELRAMLDGSVTDAFGFVAKLSSGDLVGFAEASLRRDYVNGCSSSPVLFLKGIYVDPTYRRAKIARGLFEAVRAFGKSLDCSEFASDAAFDEVDSHALLQALGFEETERVVFFRQIL
ncbi:aminoglycoside 6'-N-acetyltransferase I [Rhizobium lusitanum]|uniref:Aminoglycoside 6'-N-acetyltransferase I n=1 Tax=Rhizobium lusitanum TaxID=293958 RepID=A0A1C3WDF1_9HYPH|nr:aminoglycoside 6'-N-acetyltransferase I [Rhizobium lusitanum]